MNLPRPCWYWPAALCILGLVWVSFVLVSHGALFLSLPGVASVEATWRSSTWTRKWGPSCPSWCLSVCVPQFLDRRSWTWWSTPRSPANPHMRSLSRYRLDIPPAGQMIQNVNAVQHAHLNIVNTRTRVIILDTFLATSSPYNWAVFSDWLWDNGNIWNTIVKYPFFKNSDGSSNKNNNNNFPLNPLLSCLMHREENSTQSCFMCFFIL